MMSRYKDWTLDSLDSKAAVFEHQTMVVYGGLCLYNCKLRSFAKTKLKSLFE